jgi:hypothetical protein
LLSSDDMHHDAFVDDVSFHMLVHHHKYYYFTSA